MIKDLVFVMHQKFYLLMVLLAILVQISLLATDLQVYNVTTAFRSKVILKVVFVNLQRFYQLMVLIVRNVLHKHYATEVPNFNALMDSVYQILKLAFVLLLNFYH